ncbi:hypothetical protein [Cryptosporangium phraense]|uniref:DUF5666 domain-containing protein n=1 Tax=Cryptosporangium phraense TaxID=2593070 RepID=A0A545ANU5_9ACTN|nr:hypothetical protein [Cryptosporangium phraense]TQS42987.1 hypothetical protein FL583_21350 [Cryptosporangium phraense]
MRRLALVVLPLVAGSIIAGSIGAPALADSPNGHGRKPVPAERTKPARTTSFALTGTLTGTTASTLTLSVKGGTAPRGTTVTVSVAATARITLNDKTTTVDALPAGARVTVTGTQTDGVRTATRVQVKAEKEPGDDR